MATFAEMNPGIAVGPGGETINPTKAGAMLGRFSRVAVLPLGSAIVPNGPATPKGTPEPLTTGRLIMFGGNPTTGAGPVTFTTVAAATAMKPIYENVAALAIVAVIVYLVVRG